MTIINSKEELNNMVKEAELDIKMWNTYTLKEVYEHLYSKKEEEKYV